MKHVIAAIAWSAALGSTASLAQTMAAPSARVFIVSANPELKLAPESILPANTEIPLTLDSEINSRKMKYHAQFDLKVARDVMMGSRVAIPEGTPVTGYISLNRGRAYGLGKARITIEMQWLHIDRQVIPLVGSYHSEVRGSVMSMILVNFGLIGGLLMKERKIIFTPGTAFKAFTREPIAILFDAPQSASSVPPKLFASAPPQGAVAR
ncbi:exported hypothetical protein [Sphingomonas sp. EC-HK361]|uniref:hypothetical protein n=1 Tax=Sphingomonas sp. EC-HK361 TaxID=2038397 RepID=UPI00125C9DBE|nr:hypothetical protein [Sphingomonas sp. EC-HK361]VVT20744.1 exported hypothetical protein [Sphingomonas sp. EC-HK361]